MRYVHIEESRGDHTKGYNELGLKFSGVLPAEIKGPKGNQEYMALFCKN